MENITMERFFLRNETGGFYEILYINKCLYVERAIEYFYIPNDVANFVFVIVGTYNRKAGVVLDDGYTMKSIFVRIGE